MRRILFSVDSLIPRVQIAGFTQDVQQQFREAVSLLRRRTRYIDRKCGFRGCACGSIRRGKSATACPRFMDSCSSRVGMRIREVAVRHFIVRTGQIFPIRKEARQGPEANPSLHQRAPVFQSVQGMLQFTIAQRRGPDDEAAVLYSALLAARHYSLPASIAEALTAERASW